MTLLTVQIRRQIASMDDRLGKLLVIVERYMRANPRKFVAIALATLPPLWWKLPVFRISQSSRILIALCVSAFILLLTRHRAGNSARQRALPPPRALLRAPAQAGRQRAPAQAGP